MRENLYNIPAVVYKSPHRVSSTVSGRRIDIYNTDNGVLVILGCLYNKETSVHIHDGILTVPSQIDNVDHFIIDKDSIAKLLNALT